MYDILFLFQFDQTSLGLPTKDYFLQPSNKKYLEAYKNYLIQVSTLLGAPLDNARQQAAALINFEIRLAKVSHYKYIFFYLFEISGKFSTKQCTRTIAGRYMRHPTIMIKTLQCYRLH
jgi:hypothetical protein